MIDGGPNHSILETRAMAHKDATCMSIARMSQAYASMRTLLLTDAGSVGNNLLPPRRHNIVVNSQRIIDLGKIQHAAERAECHAHAVGAAEAAVLSAAFDVRLKIEKHAGDAAA